MTVADQKYKIGELSPAYRSTLGVDLNYADSILFVLRGRHENSASVTATPDIIDAERGIVEYQWQPGDTDVAGFYNAEWVVERNDGVVRTFPDDDVELIHIGDGR